MFTKELFLNVPEQITVPSAPAETVVIEFTENVAIKDSSPGHPQKGAILPFGGSNELNSSPITKGRELGTSKDGRPIYEFWLKVPETGLNFRPGDSIGIFPENIPASVQEVIEKQGWEDVGDKDFELVFLPSSKKKKSLVFIPEQSTIRTVLTKCIDLEKSPSKVFLLACLKYSTDPDTSRALEILCAKEMMAKYNSEVMEKRLTIREFLIKSGIKLPFSVLVEHSSRLLPRPYSILSGPSKNPSMIRLAFSLDSQKPGLTTFYLQRTILNTDNAPIYWYLRQPTQFRYEPDDEEKNVLMIGPGLGMVPFLGVLEETTNDQKKMIFTSWRNCGSDDVFLKELQGYSGLELKFSYTRESPESPKVYVQQLIEENSSEVVHLIKDPSTKIFICGEGKVMIPQIEASLVQCLSKELTLTAEESISLVKDWKTQQKLVTEQWF